MNGGLEEEVNTAWAQAPKLRLYSYLTNRGQVKREASRSLCRVLEESYLCGLGSGGRRGQDCFFTSSKRKSGKSTMDSFSSPSSGSQSSFSPEVFKDQLKNQLAQAYAEEFLETLRSKCFDKCIRKPGTSLGGSESSCISRCMDRYIEATSIISKALFSAQQR